jgi:hypothetical protein
VLNSGARKIFRVALPILFCLSSARARTGSPPSPPQDQSSQTAQNSDAGKKLSQPQNSAPQAHTQPGQAGSEEKEKAEEEKTGASKDRLFLTLPNFLTVDNALSVWGTQIGWDAVSTVVKEFWPDIRRKFHKEKQQV